MKLSINKDSTIFCLIMFIFLEPALFQQLTMIDNIFVFGKLFAGIYVISVCLLLNSRKISVAQIIVIIFFGSFVITTALADGNIFSAIRTVAFNALTVVYLDYCIRKNCNKYIKLLLQLFIVYATINFILLLIFPNGFGQYVPGYSMTEDSRLNFLGRDNTFIYFFITAIIVAFIHGSKKELYYILALSFITMVYVFSATGIIGCILIVIYALFLQGKSIDKLFNFKILSVAYVIIYYLIVIERIQEKFSYIIVDILGKDITFTGRTSLWDSAMSYISQKPWTGYGVTEKFLTTASGIAYSPHNLILQILLAGGILSLGIFIVMYWICGRKLNYKKYHLSNTIAVAIFIYLITSLTESTLNTPYLYVLLIFAYNVGIISNGQATQLKMYFVRSKQC